MSMTEYDREKDRDPQNTGQFKGMEGIRALAGFMRRSLMGRLTSFNGKRNYQQIFGWDDVISAEGMHYMYNRGGIAKRIVDSYPDAIWARPPQIWAKGDDAWTEEWEAFCEKAGVWTALHKLDKLAGLGHYSVLLLGTDKPSLEKPLNNAKEITFLQPYGETSAKIDQWDKNPTSPTFGRPIMYRIYPDSGGGLTLSNTNGGGLGSGGGSGSAGPTRSSFRVHASRILHVARNTLEDEVYGQPLMAPSWDYLTDLRKVVGSSSESYWLMANRGLQADVDKEMTLGSEDAAALQDEVQEYMDGFRRFIRTKGVKINELQNDVADPKASFDVLVTLISGTSGIPKRILLGSEAGQLASTQDKGNWAERVEEDRALHVEPHILKPFLAKLITMGIIRKPNGAANSLKVLWPDAYRMSPLERGQTQAQTARSIANVVKMLESKNPRAATLLNEEECRAILGFASDNRVLKDDPDP